MSSSKPLELLRSARSEGYALAALNAVNLETAQAVVEAAERERAPVLLQVSHNAARYAGIAPLLALARELKVAAGVPVMLHFDHAEDLPTAKRALELGCDSVMLESGDLEPRAYASALKELAEVAHWFGALVEGEFEVVAKGERHASRIAPELIAELSVSSSCDLVAIDIGTSHKQKRKTASLDLARLRSVAALVPNPLVLHGASSVSRSQLQEAVRLGISKVNVATELMMAFTNGMMAEVAATSTQEPRRYLGAGREAMTVAAQAVIRSLGSSGKSVT